MPDLPGKSLLQGIDTGSTLMSRIMQPILERERLKQAQDQFQQELALRKAQFARSGANLDLQRQIMQQNLLSLEHGNDPMYDYNKYKHIQDLLTGGDNSSGTAGIDAGIGASQSVNNMAPESSNKNSNANLELMRNNPLLRGFFKKTFGVDPLQQTPEEKQQADVSKATSIEQAKANTKKATDLEDTADTLMQYAFNNEKISDILDRNLNATGNLPAFRNFLNLGSEDTGEFNNLSIPMQGQLAKQLSTRGGAVVAKLAQGGKYNLAKSHDYNTGIRKSTTNDIINTYDTLNDRYKRLTGNNLPQKLSPFYEKWRTQSEASSPPSSKGGYNPIQMLDYKYDSKDQFINAFNSLSPQNKKIVAAEMKRRGWH